MERICCCCWIDLDGDLNCTHHVEDHASDLNHNQFNQMGKEVEKRRCKKCGSTQVYMRIKEGSVVCRSCGNIDQIKNG